MNVKVENTDNKSEVKLTFEIEAEKFEEAMKKVYVKSAKYFNIPGFRKGKAPMQLVERQYGSEIFYEDTFNELVPDIYDEAIKEKNVDAVSRPNIDVVQMEKGKDLIFTAIVQTKPEVKLGKYKGIEIPKVEYNVTDEDVDKDINSMLDKNSRLVSVEDRPVEIGDTAVINFEGFLDGVPFEGGKGENHDLIIGSNSFIPGFEEKVIGMEIGKEKDLDLSFPKEYFSEELAGKAVVFKVTVNEIKMKELPELDDEFAKDVSEFDTLEELKASIKEKIQISNEEKAKYETQDAAIKAVCDATNIDIPSGMVELEVDNMVKEIESKLSYQGMNFEMYTSMMGKTEADMRKEFEEQAGISVKSRLVLEAIIKEEKFEASSEEVKEKLKEMSEMYGKEEEELLSNEALMEYLAESVKNEKAIDFVVANAKMK